KDWFRYESHFVHGRDSLVDILKERGLLSESDRKSGSAGMPRPISYAVFCLKKKKNIDALFAQHLGKHQLLLHTVCYYSHTQPAPHYEPHPTWHTSGRCASARRSHEPQLPHFLCLGSEHHRHLHSFPTRRSSDLKDWFRYESHFVHGRDSLVDILKERGLLSESRSEERRVGKECRSRWSPYH